MKKAFHILLKIFTILSVVLGVLFAVYFWNIDQKVMGWVYTQVNRIHDRKSTDIKF